MVYQKAMCFFSNRELAFFEFASYIVSIQLRKSYLFVKVDNWTVTL